MSGKRTAPGASLTGAGVRGANDQVAPAAGADRRESVSAGKSTQDTRACDCQTDCMTRHYLSLQGVADHLGVSRNTVAKLRLPKPDVIVGSGLNAPRGWSVATIDKWNAQRKGPGNWGPRSGGAQ